MRWFDTHCHLDRLPAGSDLAATLLRSRKAGVEKIVVPGVAGSPQSVAELSTFPGVSLAWGVHPDFINYLNAEEPTGKPWQAAGFEPVAIGECGLDRRSMFITYYNHPYYVDHLQRLGFQIELHQRGPLRHRAEVGQQRPSGMAAVAMARVDGDDYDVGLHGA